MCGIAGFSGTGTREDLERMIDAIDYRGPDDRGIFLKEAVGLGHARLSIIDLSVAGHQPMASANGRHQIVFNGEIYNFQELRSLVPDYPFASKTDTEVILALYEKYGEGCFEKLDGMFALAVYDAQEGKIVLARDRMGKKPLYWHFKDGNFVFASELKAILAHSAVKKSLDHAAVAKYLWYEYVPTPHTILKDIYKLEPATSLTFHEGQINKCVFWRPDLSEKPVSEEEALKTLDRLLERAVKKRLVADVPLGIFLSGGIDSSTVAYYAQKDNPEKIKTFSIGFTEESFDESRHARNVAEFLGTEHHEAFLSSKEVTDLMRRCADIIDEPLADPSLIPTYLLASHARQKVTVALGGDGGDELFLGYPMFQADIPARVYEKLPLRVRQRLLEPLINRLPVSHVNLGLDFKLKQFAKGFSVPTKYRHQEWISSFGAEAQQELLAHPLNPSFYEDIDYHISGSGSLDPVKQRNYLYLRMYLMDDILAKVDRASMKNSLEVRTPFLDRDVVDFANGLPEGLKQKGFTTKYILKKLMAGKLPENIVRRPKKGFGIPLAAWLNADLKNLCNEVLSRDNVMETGLFNWEYVAALKEGHFTKRTNNYKQLWTLMIFLMWYERWYK